MNVSQRKGYLRSVLLSTIVDLGLLLLFLSPLLPRSAAAQSSPEKLSAQRFLDQVARSHPQLRISEAEIDTAAAHVSTAGLWTNPTISYEREEVFEDGRGMPENLFRIDLPLEISGRRSLLVDSAEQGVKAARSDAAAARVAILAKSMSVYLQATAWQKRHQILKESRDALARLRDTVRATTSAGDTSGYDLARIEIEVSSVDNLTTHAERELATHRFVMGMLAGRPGKQIEPAPSLAQAPPVGVATNGSAAPSLARALPALPVVAARHRVSQHQLSRDAAGRGWVPTVTLTGGVKSVSGIDQTAWGYVAGVGLTIPIFDHGQADKLRANADLKRAQARLAAAEYQTATNIAIAREALQRTTRQARAFEKLQLPRLQKLMRRAEVSYQEGERPVFDLIDAHRAAREVRMQQVDLELQVQRSRLELLKALGRAPGGHP